MVSRNVQTYEGHEIVRRLNQSQKQFTCAPDFHMMILRDRALTEMLCERFACRLPFIGVRHEREVPLESYSTRHSGCAMYAIDNGYAHSSFSMGMRGLSEYTLDLFSSSSDAASCEFIMICGRPHDSQYSTSEPDTNISNQAPANYEKTHHIEKTRPRK